MSLAPELLVVVLDGRLGYLVERARESPVAGFPAAGKVAALGPEPTIFPALWAALSVLLAAHAALALDQRVALYMAHARRVVRLATGVCAELDVEAARRAAAKSLLEEDVKHAGEIPQLGAALGRALCYVSRLRAEASTRDLPARILVFDGSDSQAEFTPQGASLVSSGFAARSAKVPIDLLSLGRAASVQLRQVCSIAGGKHHELLNDSGVNGDRPHTLADALSHVLLWHFLPGVAVRGNLHISADMQHLPAVCRCHSKVVDMAYVCSCCLAILCADDVAICPSCSTRFKPERLAERQMRS